MSAREFPRDRLDQLFAAIDSKDSQAFVGFLTDNAIFRFGSAPPIAGRSAIAVGVTAFFDSIAGCRHSIDRVMADGDTLACEGDVTYTRLDGSTVTVPFVDVFELNDSLISEYKIYIDVSPLYQT